MSIDVGGLTLWGRQTSFRFRGVLVIYVSQAQASNSTPWASAGT